MFLKRLQIGLIHSAVAITLVPINSTLNRILIEDQGMLATLVVLLFSPPYLFSFIQVAIGSFADRNPIFGLRRTPYILAGLLLCVISLVMATQMATLLQSDFWNGLGLGLLTFGAWGMGFNLATVSYFSLASEISGEHGRSKTTATMFFMMIVSIIATSITLSRMLRDFSQDTLENAFLAVAIVALVMGFVGILGLEKRSQDEAASKQHSEVYSLRQAVAEISSNRQVALFFGYLVLMLAAILGQDVLLEPYAARAFAMPVEDTTRITSIWGTCYLISLVITGMLEGRASKLKIARFASWGAIAAFALVALSGLLASQAVFYIGVVLLGLATGPATVSNLSLMLDMTVPGKIGLFIGAWGSASAFARLVGSLLTAVVRDLVNLLPGTALYGYVSAFIIQGLFLVLSLVLLNKISILSFQKNASSSPVIERAAMASDIA
jgi:BCD family chlorophyll transporter-like MFS transporter